MRRNWITDVRALLVYIMMILTCSCQMDMQDELQVTWKAGIYAGGGHTRTQMQPDGLSAVWEEGDELALWARNSSGSYILSNQRFITYGTDYERGFFTTTLSGAMAQDTYTYFCCYPAPVSVNGTKATFSLPSVQDGKASDGADIMIATPVEHGPLTAVPDPEDHSGLSLQMNRMMHQFRFYIPEGTNVIGEDIVKIDITMPDNIVGNVIADLSDPDGTVQLSGGSKTVSLELAEPIGESDFATAEFACVAVFPHDAAYTESDYMNLTVYTNSGKSVLDPISLAGRSFLAGHSTPVRLLTKPAVEYCRLVVRTGRNYIGEALWNITITSGEQTLFRYANTAGTYENIVHVQEYTGADGKASYEALVNAVAAGTAMLNFETNHATVDIPMTADMLIRNGNQAELNLGDVPYLLYEDFSTALQGSEADEYSASTDSNTSTTGYLLNDYLSQTGWNASRFGILAGDCIRINCRYEGAVFAYRKYCGRLDTPALKRLKSGTSVNVVIEYDKAFYIPAGYNIDTSGAKAKYYVGYHTKSEDSTLSGIGIGSTSESNITSNSTIVYTSGVYASENVGNMSSERVVIPSATSSTRVAFYVNTTETEIAFLGMNSCYYLYLDNIRVYIGN